MKLELYAPLWPLKGINQFFGNSDPRYPNGHHNGLDFYATHATPIYASHDGLAQYQVDVDGGHGVIVISNEEFEMTEGTSYIKTIYWHMIDPHKEPQFTSPLVGKTGFTPVKRGEMIGYVDSTGNSTGDHLHYGLKRVKKTNTEGVWVTLKSNNGYQGAIDPIPYLVPKFDGTIHEPTYKFTRDLTLASQGEDVKKLQEFLNTHGFILATTGNGSPGKETGYFGNLTQNALIKYQLANNITPSVGYFGIITRNLVNAT